MSWRWPGFDRARVLALAALASSEADQDPIDAAVWAAAKAAPQPCGRAAGAVRSFRSGDQEFGGLHRRSGGNRTPHHQRGIRNYLEIGGSCPTMRAPWWTASPDKAIA